MAPDTHTQISRRRFIKNTSLAGTALSLSSVLYAASEQQPKKEKLGIGVIGTGERGRNHLRVLNRLKENGGEKIEFVAVCDAYRPRLDKVAKAYNAKAYSNHKDLIADRNVDVVCIATCDHQHGYHAIDAIQAGKDVYCEKPVTHWRQFELTRNLLDAVNKSDQVFQLGTQAMSDSAWRQMKKLVQNGLIGQPLSGETGFFRTGDWGERGMPIPDPNAKVGKDLDWEAFLGDAPKCEFSVDRYFRWRLFMDYAGGPITDLYPHSLTQVIDILGVDMPESVVGLGGIHRYDYELREVPDTFNLIAQYPENVSITVTGTQGNDFQTTTARGSGQRTPVIRGWDGSLTISENNKEILFTPVRIKGAKPPQKFAIEQVEDLTRYWKQFLHDCRTRNKKTYSPMSLAFRTQTVLQMAMLGWRAGKTTHYDKVNRNIIV